MKNRSMGGFFCSAQDDPRTKQQIQNIQAKKKINIIHIHITSQFLMKLKSQNVIIIGLFHATMLFIKKIKMRLIFN